MSRIRSCNILLPLFVLIFAPAAWGLWPTHGARRPNQPGTLYWHGDPGVRKVALTFDDGPSKPFTNQILDILHENNIKGTFFMVGKNAERYPEIAQRIVQEGHAIGNHSFSHSDFAFLTKRGEKREMLQGEEAIERVTGTHPTLFRPPHGRLNNFVLRQAKQMGLVTVEWTVSPRDWKAPPGEKIVQRIISRVKNGGIILLHDGYFHKKYEDRSPTVAALPVLIQELEEQGYTLVTVPELLGLSAADVRNHSRFAAKAKDR